MRLAFLPPLLAIALSLADCDPVHTDAVDALGPEVAGVREGPLHRSGQPCLRCHDGTIGLEFTVAGTIYQNESGLVAAQGARVSLTDSAGKSYEAVANSVGNFYVVPQELTPTYPMKVSVTYGSVVVTMSSVIGRDGSCAGCHFDPVGPTTAGHIFIPADGVTP